MGSIVQSNFDWGTGGFSWWWRWAPVMKRHMRTLSRRRDGQEKMVHVHVIDGVYECFQIKEKKGEEEEWWVGFVAVGPSQCFKKNDGDVI